MHSRVQACLGFGEATAEAKKKKKKKKKPHTECLKTFLVWPSVWGSFKKKVSSFSDRVIFEIFVNF